LHEVLKVPPPVDEHGDRVLVAGEEESRKMEEDSIIKSSETLVTKDSGVKKSLEPLEKVALQQPPPPQPPAKAAATVNPPSSVEVAGKLDKMNINAAVDDIDDELDALLGLGVTAAVPKQSGTASLQQGSKTGEKEDSLEAWLDNL
jgi:hypothetical protein